ncbi:transketolase [Entamoeba marina]
MSVEDKCIETIRVLACDMINQAKSGHPGVPTGCATIAHTLFSKHLKFDPTDPSWISRDRFVLSNGHGSSLLYVMNHLCGYKITMDDLKQFRQLDSLTPGHPEFGWTDGVEVTGGPLGAGMATAVAVFNTDNHKIIDNYTYVLLGDGCLMEGVTSESASLAGHMKLNKLICLYDDNQITIDGSTNLAFTEDVSKRFDSYNWNVLKVDGNNIQQIDEALINAKQSDKPTLIICKTVIGKGLPNKEGTSKAHGEPPGSDLDLMKKSYGMEGSFIVSEEVKQFYNKVIENGEATRISSGKVFNEIAKVLPEIIGGTADVGGSVKVVLPGPAFHIDNTGRNIHFGVREHAMGNLVNGMSIYGGLIAYGSAFFVFSDYMRPTVRLAALSHYPSIFVFTHDSIGVGEDGPTHQPIEHLLSFRCMPNCLVIRPSDSNETRVAWKIAVENNHGPTLLIMARQNSKVIDRKEFASSENVRKGGYILKDYGTPEVILMATGTEVDLAINAAELLHKEGLGVRVVSFPSWELFEQQSVEYKQTVLPKNIKARVSVEAGTTFGWERYIGDCGISVGMNSFGASAPIGKLYNKFGITVEKVVEAAHTSIKQTKL